MAGEFHVGNLGLKRPVGIAEGMETRAAIEGGTVLIDDGGEGAALYEFIATGEAVDDGFKDEAALYIMAQELAQRDGTIHNWRFGINN